MRKALTFLSASLALAGIAIAAGAQMAPDAFKDVDKNHWAYEALENLRSKGILIGYPDGYFRGRRTLTRYEFAVALDRALKQVMAQKGDKGDPGPPGQAGGQGDKGDVGPQGPAGVAPEELEAMKKLADTFKEELASLGTNVNAVRMQLDKLAKDVEEVKKTVAGMPKISGKVFTGIRSDRVSLSKLFVDRDGRPSFGPGGYINAPAVLHGIALGIDANAGHNTKVTGEIVNDNYLSYLGGTFGSNGVPGAQGGAPLGGFSLSNDTYINKLEISTPFGAVGRNSMFTIGRFAEAISHLTLMKPDGDTYFYNPYVDDGKFRMDGVKVDTNFGSVKANFFAGQTGSATATVAGAFNSPFAGATSPSLGIGGEGAGKPFGQNLTQGQFMVYEAAGATFSYSPSHVRGLDLRATGLAAAGPGFSPGVASNVVVMDGEVGYKFSDRLHANGEWAKSITGNGQFSSLTTVDNQAFIGNVHFKSGMLGLSAGYKYIDPMFYAPGYWGRIGNWLNPTNIQGPTFRAEADVTPVLGVNVGGDFYSAAKNRGGFGSLERSDDIQRVLAGLRWNVSKAFKTTLDWEGVYYSVGGSATSAFGPTLYHPQEQYVRIGTGYSLTNTTMLRLGYEIGTYNGRGLTQGAAGSKFNYNTFTSQVAVKF